MKPLRLACLLLVSCWLTPSSFGQGLPVAAPEQVGLSSSRLARIVTVMDDQVKRDRIAGAVTLVARRGKVVHLEAHGMMDIEANRAMEEDALFRIASMTKPVTCTHPSEARAATSTVSDSGSAPSAGSTTRSSRSAPTCGMAAPAPASGWIRPKS
jgi:hypothetical protein